MLMQKAQVKAIQTSGGADAETEQVLCLSVCVSLSLSLPP